tara:strand:- start:722 stop:940 length:219 start_codon:yes stop_codon:yes gene_type:complete
VSKKKNYEIGVGDLVIITNQRSNPPQQWVWDAHKNQTPLLVVERGSDDPWAWLCVLYGDEKRWIEPRHLKVL